MAYNPYTYSTPAPQQVNPYPVQPTVFGGYPQPQQFTQSNVIWVQGEAAAKAYPVQAGNSMILLDSENDCFYIKSSDNAGMPNRLRKFEYKEVVDGQIVNETPADQPQYVTKEDLERALSELKQQRQHYNNNRKGDRNEQPV